MNETRKQEPARDDGLEVLKARLIGEHFHRSADPADRRRIECAANEAASLAWASQFPLLTFPVLFEEKARRAAAQARRQRRIFDRSLAFRPSAA